MEPLTATTPSTTSWLVCIANFNILIRNEIFLAYQQQQMNALCHSILFQQAQMGALQSQVQLPHGNNLTSMLFSSRSFIPSTSQTIYSVAPQSTTVHTPVTTVQSYSEQHNSASLSSSQVRTATYNGFVSFNCTVYIAIYIP